MGTRSVTTIRENGKPICAFYRQFDGYPSGHGREISDFMSGMVVINGFNNKMEAGNYANGAGCFAAQLIAKLKTQIGNVYMVAIPDGPNDEEEYMYDLDVTDTGITTTIRGYGELLFESNSRDMFAAFVSDPNNG